MLGIDVSKRLLTCTLVDPETRRARWSLAVPNTEEGIRRLLRRTPPDVAWVLEPTGRYGDLAVKLARESRRDVRMAQPKQAKFFLRSLQDRAKTERVDSYGLGCYGVSVPLPAYPEKTPAQEQLEQLQVARRGVAQALMQLQQRVPELPHAAAGLEAAAAALRTQLAAFDAQIAELLQQLAGQQQVERLRAVTGIGPVTAAAVLSCLLSRPFPTADQFVAYTGLDPRVRETGEQKAKRRLSKQGPGELRRLLYLAARSNLRVKDSPFRHQYERELAKGLCPQAALCSVARKLARTCWSLVTHEEPYRPERVHQPPDRRRDAAPL